MTSVFAGFIEISQVREWLQSLAPTVLFVLTYLTALVLSTHALIRVRTSQGAIAWVLSLLLLPYVAIPAYLIFGWRRVRGYRRSLRASRQEVLELLRPSKLQNFGSESEGFPLSLRRLAQLPATMGNRIILHSDGEESFAAKLRLIGEARRYILLQSYILRNDRSGGEIITALLEKARQGIKVYVLFDDIGSYGLRRGDIRRMRDGGIDIQGFRSSRFRSNRFRINFRNHRKLLVVDGESAILGGSNIGNEYRGMDQFLGYWRDTDIEVHGPAVQCCQLAFIEDWLWGSEVVPSLEWLPKEEEKDGEALLISATGPADDWEACGLTFVEMINQARKDIIIATPYFVPDPPLLTALRLAILRGVRIELLVPDRTDQWFVQLASHNYMSQMAEIGVRCYAYQKGFMHQKALVIDESLAMVGSANMDNRSFRLNFELMAIFKAQKPVQELVAALRDDISDSKLLTREHWRNASLFTRMQWGFARLFSPIL